MNGKTRNGLIILIIGVLVVAERLIGLKPLGIIVFIIVAIIFGTRKAKLWEKYKNAKRTGKRGQQELSDYNDWVKK